MDWNKQRNDWASGMNPCPVWYEGTDAQQEFADELVESFCKRFSKYLCWAVKDGLVETDDIENLVNNIFFAINNIDDAKWWCNKKSTADFSIALKLLEDYEDDQDIVKKIRKKYS